MVQSKKMPEKYSAIRSRSAYSSQINDFFQGIGAGEPTGFIVDEEGLPVFQLSSSQLTSLLGSENGAQAPGGQKYVFELGETSKLSRVDNR